MKTRRSLALFIVFMFIMGFFPLQQVRAAQTYSEKLTVNIAGSDAIWFMSFNGVNVTSSDVAAAEAVPGVNSYNLTAIKTTGWTLDSQVFGPNGYNVIPVPFIPTQGAFLTVGAASFSDASSAAAAFDSYLFTSFTSYSNSTGSFVFYSPISFGSIVPSKLLTLVPTGMGGFASAITATGFMSTQSPMVMLGGSKGGSGFTHVLTLGSIATSALNSASTPVFSKYFGGSVSLLKAANKSTSSVIDFRFLDGVISSADQATVTSNSYSLTLSQGQKVGSLNLTVAQVPTPLFVQRVVDTGVLMPNQNVSVTLSFENLEGLSNITTTGFSDNWWKSYGFFTLVKGDSTINSTTIVAGNTYSPTYVLRYTGGTAQQIHIPPTVVSYSYKVGSRAFKGTAYSNPMSLSVGTDEPVVFAYVVPTTTGSNYGEAVGSTQNFNIVAKNIGTLTASSVVIADQQVGGLVAGASTTIPISVNAQSLVTWNLSKTYAVSYSTPGGKALVTATNPIPVYFSHSSMSFGLPSLSVKDTIAYPKSGKTNLTLVLTALSRGTIGSTSFLAESSLPRGLACGKINGTGFTCSGGRIRLSIPDLGTKSQEASIKFNLSSSANYLFSPIVFHGISSGLNLSGTTDPFITPTGITLTKQFSTSLLFGNMTSVVKINALNSGPFHAYNATIVSRADSFDSISPTFVSTRFAKDITPGGNLNQTYNIVTSKSSQALGNWTSSPVSVSFYMGGTFLTVNKTGPAVGILQTASASVKTSPASPTEGRAFSISITINNPSGVDISNVRFSVQIPSSVSFSQLTNATFSSGSLVVTVGHLAPNHSYSANLTAQATSGVTLPFSKAALTFSYSGVTVGGSAAKQDVIIGEDVLTRYTLPTIIVLVAVLATAFYVRRKGVATSPSSQP